MWRTTQTCSVYCLLNIRTGKVYIGRTSFPQDRYKQHRAVLRMGRHTSKRLQAAWRRSGEAAFEYFVVWTGTLDEAGPAEAFYINWFHAIGLCYNRLIPALWEWAT